MCVTDLRVELRSGPAVTALGYATDASAIVIGLGGLTISGRKPTAPDELPDNVLETADGRIAHQLARRAHSDLIVVLDTIEIHHGVLARATAVAAAAAADTAGTVATGYAAMQHRTDQLD